MSEQEIGFQMEPQKTEKMEKAAEHLLYDLPPSQPQPPSSHSSEERSRSRDRHPVSDSRPHDVQQYGAQLSQEPKEETYFKTKICPAFMQNDCKKGISCNFAHGEKQLRGLPNFKKTRLCIPFRNGDCGKRSEDCKYAHGEGQLRKVTNTFKREDIPYRSREERRPRAIEPERDHHYRGQREEKARSYYKEDRYIDNREYRDGGRDYQRDNLRDNLRQYQREYQRDNIRDYQRQLLRDYPRTEGRYHQKRDQRRGRQQRRQEHSRYDDRRSDRRQERRHEDRRHEDRRHDDRRHQDKMDRGDKHKDDRYGATQHYNTAYMIPHIPAGSDMFSSGSHPSAVYSGGSGNYVPPPSAPSGYSSSAYSGSAYGVAYQGSYPYVPHTYPSYPTSAFSCLFTTHIFRSHLRTCDLILFIQLSQGFYFLIHFHAFSCNYTRFISH